MLQQTQVPRVLEKYKEFLTAFPAVRILAKAKLSDVLKVWSGLGYNRRGKYLHDAAKKIVEIGNIKKALAEPLPGVGPYTRAAVRTFAYNEPHTMIETNIRAAYIHHFSSEEKIVSDKDIVPLIEKGAADQDPRKWHWALMDYGSYLKKQHVNPSRRSAGYTKQSKFEGSLRQVRGAILKELHKAPSYLKALPFETESIKKALFGLEKDGIICKEKGKWQIV
jgi:A/G-specific adenine glycosylase